MIAAALILGFLLITTLLATGGGWNNVLSADRNELVFAHRNREYGAYKLRQEHHRTMVIAVFAALGLMGSIVLLPTLFHTAGETPISRPPDVVDVTLVTPVIDVPAAKPPTLPQPPAPKPSGPVLSGGPLVAIDPVAVVPVDTLSSTTPTPVGPVGGTPGPSDPGTGKAGGTGIETGTKETWELEALPEYPGGEPAMHRYLSKTVRYPEIDITAGHEGRVTVGFIVRSDGNVTDVKILKGVSPTIDAEAVRVVKAMGKWKPGKFNKREVDVRYALPIVFKLAKK